VIDPLATVQTDAIGPTVVVLAEEETPTGGHYKCDSVAFTAVPATETGPVVTTFDFRYPFPINLLSTSSTIDATHTGNVLDVYFVPDTVIGGTTQFNGVDTDSTVGVSGTVLPSIPVGCHIRVADNRGEVDLGTVVSRDANHNELVVTGDAPRPFSQGSTVTATYGPHSGTLTLDATDSAITVDPELAALAIVGARVVVAGEPAGIVTAVQGDLLTVSGVTTGAAGDPVVLDMPLLTTTLTEDLLPHNVLEVQDSCVQYARIGMSIKITDGVNTDDLGRVVSIDKATRRIEVETAPSRDYPAGSYIMVTRYFIQGMEFGGAGTYNFSGSRNKGSYIEPGKTGRFAYTNRSNQPVRFTMNLEYLY
jgi:hypothetical protein